MAEIIRITYQFKRGTKWRWLEVNPVLRAGEPGYEYDTGQLKIGDGFTPWATLPYLSVGESEMVSVETKDQLPVPGDPSKLYRVVEEKMLYQWNDTWEPIAGSGGIDPSKINLINGGNANG